MSRRTVVAAAAATVLAPGLIGLTLAAGQTGGSSEVSAALSPQPAGTFTCRASTLRLTGKGPLAGQSFEPFVANRGGAECADGDEGVVNPAVAIPGGLGTVRVLFASTDAAGHSAEAGVAQVVLTVPGAPVIRVDLLTSEARTVCTATGPAFESDSDVVRLQIGEEVVEVPEGPQDIAVPGVPLTLSLNQETTEATADGAKRTQRALFLDTPLGEVVIAESVADHHNNPCRPPSPDPTPSVSVTPSPDPSPSVSRSPSPSPSSSPSARPHVPGGFMTGGGRFGSPSTETTGSSSHGMVIPCTIGANPGPNLTVNWDTANFKLDRITAIRCTDEPGFDPENPRAGFDTVEGTGTGTCRNKRGNGSGTAQIRFRFTDQGEPGRNRDTASVDITGFCTWSSSGTLTPGGNHQAHGPNEGKPTTASPQPSASASPKKGGKG